jgi:hypothetical protein
MRRLAVFCFLLVAIGLHAFRAGGSSVCPGLGVLLAGSRRVAALRARAASRLHAALLRSSAVGDFAERGIRCRALPFNPPPHY